jgi:nickel superoxide dismutase
VTAPRPIVYNREMKHLIPLIAAEAHCDVPCGIYDPTPAKIAAKTVARMVDQIEDTHPPKDWNDAAAASLYVQSISRRVAVKEEHAQLCKKELYILWSDFFKPEHLAKYPNLHEMFWKATKLCSKDKQNISKEDAAALCGAVDEIAKVFYEVKGDPARFKAYQEITDKLY